MNHNLQSQVTDNQYWDPATKLCKHWKWYLWLIRVRSREALREGKINFSLKRGFASINFLSSISMILRADLVSPYLDSCSFSLKSSRGKHEQPYRTVQDFKLQSSYSIYSKDKEYHVPTKVPNENTNGIMYWIWYFRLQLWVHKVLKNMSRRKCRCHKIRINEKESTEPVQKGVFALLFGQDQIMNNNMCR